MPKIKIKKKVKKTRKDTKVVDSPYKIGEYDAYLIWYNLPIIIKRLAFKNKIEEIKALGFDINDPLIKILVNIKTKTDFAIKFKLERKTLNRWEETKEFKEKSDERINDMVIKHKKDIDFNFTIKTMKEADAKRVKLWKQLYEGWEEKQKIEHSGKLSLSNLFDESKKDE